MEWSESVAAEGASPVNTNNDYKQLAISNKSTVQQYSDEAVEKNKEYINIGWCIINRKIIISVLCSHSTRMVWKVGNITMLTRSHPSIFT